MSDAAESTGFYLPAGLPRPAPKSDSLDAPFWVALQQHELMFQRCTACHRFQWGPEWICHRCLSRELKWTEVAPAGRIYSWERPWHPVDPALADVGPYLIVLVEFPQADDCRIVGNLLGDPLQDVEIGAAVEGVFEDHDGYTLLQWRIAGTQ